MAGGCRTAPESRPAGIACFLHHRFDGLHRLASCGSFLMRPFVGRVTNGRSANDPERGRARHPKPAPNPTCAITDARTDQGPFPTSPTDGYRVLGYVAHFRAVVATCLSGAQANLRPSPTPPTDHHRAPGPRRSPSGPGNNVPLWPPDKPRACAKLTHKRFSGTRSSHLSAPSIFDGPWLAAAIAILPALVTFPATGEARTHLGPSPVWPADGFRAYDPHRSIVGG